MKWEVLLLANKIEDKKGSSIWLHPHSQNFVKKGLTAIRTSYEYTYRNYA